MAPGWMPILHPSGLMIPGQFGPTRRDLDWLLSAFMTYSGPPTGSARNSRGASTGRTHPDLVLLGDALRDTDNQPDLVLNRLDDSIRGGGWWHVEDGRIGLHIPDGLRRMSGGKYCCSQLTYLTNGAKNGKSEMGLTGLLGGDTTDHARPVLERLLHMESTLSRLRMSRGRICIRKEHAQSFQ